MAALGSRAGFGLRGRCAVNESTAASRSVAKAAVKAPDCPLAGSGVVGFARAVAGGETAPAGAEEAARDAITRALSDKPISLASVEQSRDRYGRTVAQVFEDGLWGQAALLKTGEVRAAPDLASAPCAKALLAAESEARDGRLANWRGAFRLRDPDDIRNRTGSFQNRGGQRHNRLGHARAFINFGADYRTDFTVTIDPDDMRIFGKIEDFHLQAVIHARRTTQTARSCLRAVTLFR